MLAVPVLPAASLAVKVMVFAPSCRPMLAAVQGLGPCAVPLPPLLLDQETWVTPSLSLAVPLRVITDDEVVDGPDTFTDGADVSGRFSVI